MTISDAKGADWAMTGEGWYRHWQCEHVGGQSVSGLKCLQAKRRTETWESRVLVGRTRVVARAEARWKVGMEDGHYDQFGGIRRSLQSQTMEDLRSEVGCVAVTQGLVTRDRRQGLPLNTGDGLRDEKFGGASSCFDNTPPTGLHTLRRCVCWPIWYHTTLEAL